MPLERELRERKGGYRIEYSGQFEAQQQANFQRLLILGGLAVLGVFLLLCKRVTGVVAGCVAGAGERTAGRRRLGPRPGAAQPPRLSGGLPPSAPWWQRPGLWLAATSLSVAHWVGFITLIGIVSRNGIMMISHYIHLMKHEGEKFGEKMIVRGTLERLAPVLMTAAVAVIGLVPLALGAGQTGKEILHPLAVVVIGGLVASTLLDQVVTPALFLLFGRKVYGHLNDRAQESEDFTRPAEVVSGHNGRLTSMAPAVLNGET